MAGMIFRMGDKPCAVVTGLVGNIVCTITVHVVTVLLASVRLCCSVVVLVLSLCTSRLCRWWWAARDSWNGDRISRNINIVRVITISSGGIIFSQLCNFVVFSINVEYKCSCYIGKLINKVLAMKFKIMGQQREGQRFQNKLDFCVLIRLQNISNDCSFKPHGEESLPDWV